MTIKEIEAACDAAQPLDFSRHSLEVCDLPLKRTFYPLGFPAEVQTNSAEVLELYEELWGAFEKLHDTPPILARVCVTEGGSAECPPAPVFRISLPQMTGVSDADNLCVVDFEQNSTEIFVSSATLRHRLFLKYCFLGTPMACIATRYTTPVHAGCVSLDGRGVLLCGDSGAGKSTLSYACARAGWTYTSDDGAFLSLAGDDLLVTGDCHKVRFRPTAGDLFSEVKGLEVIANPIGKASMELRSPMSHITCAQTTQVDFVVFINRHSKHSPELVPYRKDVARYSMLQTLYGLPEIRVAQEKTIERLLALPVLELHYTDLEWGIGRLRQLVQEGR